MNVIGYIALLYSIVYIQKKKKKNYLQKRINREIIVQKK